MSDFVACFIFMVEVDYRYIDTSSKCCSHKNDIIAFLSVVVACGCLCTQCTIRFIILHQNFP